MSRSPQVPKSRCPAPEPARLKAANHEPEGRAQPLNGKEDLVKPGYTWREVGEEQRSSAGKGGGGLGVGSKGPWETPLAKMPASLVKLVLTCLSEHFLQEACRD